MSIFDSFWLIWELYFKKGIPNIRRIQSLGLLAVKIGQIHALRLDFLSAEKCAELSKLYRSNSAIPEEDIDILIRSAGGEKYKDNFSHIESEPLAVASVGQVYRAELKDGTPVVIKVLKKSFKDRFTHDVARMRKFFSFILFFRPHLKSVGNPMGILNDIEEYTLAELDLRNEAKGKEILKGVYDAYKDRFDLSSLAFVSEYEHLSGENILVSEYVDAPTVDELLEQGKFTYEDMLKLFYIQGFFIFIAGKFHGDMHPANVLYDGKKFYFVDTAFVGVVGDRIRKGLFFFFEALSRYDYRACAKFLNEMAEEGIGGEKFTQFESDFAKLYQNYTHSTVSEVSLTRQMMLTIKLGVNSGMKFEKGIFAIIRSLMYLDGMVLKCNPDAVLVKDMRQFIDVYKSEV
ncbi:MAG: AarF/UbiB family protein [Candidatus Paceibacterota bacterium]